MAHLADSPEAGPFARAASIASAAVLVHSLVDFPLRTAAISACFGMCLALLADSRAAPPKEETELRRKRHVEFREGLRPACGARRSGNGTAGWLVSPAGFEPATY